MSDLLFISRNFTELGGFKSEEVLDFYKRQILNHDDYVRTANSEEWLPLHSWISGAQSNGASPIAATASTAATSPASGKSAKPTRKDKPAMARPLA
jgi:hypothetical protein